MIVIRFLRFLMERFILVY